MSEDASSSNDWQPLSPLERRVLGVLIEKQKTSKSPDAYPMTLNAITTGCNQKSNRDPVMELSEEVVEETLSTLQRKLMVQRVTGSRVDRFRHLLYENWNVNKDQMAVLAELLLRGPQTKGELRARAARMEPIDSLDALEDILKPLVERKLVIYLTDPNRRGAVLTHGFHTAEELNQARLSAAHVVATEGANLTSLRPQDLVSSPTGDKIQEAFAAIQSLQSRVTELEQYVRQIGEKMGLSAKEHQQSFPEDSAAS